MKKLLKIFTITTIALLFIATTAFATDATATLSASSTKVKVGETFSVTLSAQYEGGIDGINGTINYDETVLELVSGAVKTSNWTSIPSENGEIAIMGNDSEPEKSADIYVWTFKVKDTTKTSTEIKIPSVCIDSTEEKTVSTNTLSITIEKVATGEENSDIGDDEEKTPTKTTEPTKTTTDTNKDTTTAGKTLAKAGLVKYGTIGVVIIAIVTVITYVQYKKYREL